VTIANALVQTFVWAALLGFLYLTWEHRQTAAIHQPFDLAFHLRRLLRGLESLWVVVCIVWIIVILALILPPLFQSAAQATGNCATAPQQALSIPDTDASTSQMCMAPEPTPASMNRDSNHPLALLILGDKTNRGDAKFASPL